MKLVVSNLKDEITLMRERTMGTYGISSSCIVSVGVLHPLDIGIVNSAHDRLKQHAQWVGGSILARMGLHPFEPHHEKVARLFNGPTYHPGMILMSQVVPLSIDVIIWPRIDDDHVSSFNLDDEKFQNEDTLPWNASDPVQIVRAIYDTEEATAQTFDILTDNKWITQNSCSSYNVPPAFGSSSSIQKGTAEILVNFDDLWPLNTSNSSQGTSIMQTGDVTKVFPICGKKFLVDIGMSQNISMRCVQRSISISHGSLYVLWLWSSHNKVNERLMAVEQEWRTGDSSCAEPKTGNTKLDWNEDEVYNFLKQHYSISSLSPPSNDETGKSSIKGMSVSDDAASSTHAVTVPVSAALAIALASCAFGALACFLEDTTEEPEVPHQLHSLKNV
ncbi:hypothetical protein HPP92_020123 [Vanilla planifolia]|uniref:Uncharacterized protein n=1 Tax=Vanilla planifolia TaxID=51239 RepID=A0A835Q6M7_VANPL|nr:hypothetical protein HPP92_020123 [Vanilla planifolia]